MLYLCYTKNTKQWVPELMRPDKNTDFSEPNYKLITYILLHVQRLLSGLVVMLLHSI